MVIGGSGGSEPSYVAESLAAKGVAAMSVAYFARPELPSELREIRWSTSSALSPSSRAHSRLQEGLSSFSVCPAAARRRCLALSTSAVPSAVLSLPCQAMSSPVVGLLAAPLG